MKRVALRDEDLCLDQVDAGHHFGDGMLHLNARVDLDEIPLLRIDVVEKFDGASIAVVGFVCKADGGFAEFVAHRRWQIRRRSNFHHFLMAALNRTVSLVQMQKIAVIVGKYLDFEMTRTRQIFFEKDRRIAKGRFCFALRFFETSGELRFIVNDAHAAAAAAHRGFYDHRVADFFGDFVGFGRRLHRIFRAG